MARAYQPVCNRNMNRSIPDVTNTLTSTNDQGKIIPDILNGDTRDYIVSTTTDTQHIATVGNEQALVEESSIRSELLERVEFVPERPEQVNSRRDFPPVREQSDTLCDTVFTPNTLDEPETPGQSSAIECTLSKPEESAFCIGSVESQELSNNLGNVTGTSEHSKACFTSTTAEQCTTAMATQTHHLPQTELKHLGLNGAPTPFLSEIKCGSIQNHHNERNQLQIACDSDDKNETLLVRNNTWLPSYQFSVPNQNNILLPVLYEYEQFTPLNVIINQIAEGEAPRPQVTMRYELLRICTFRTYPTYNKPFLTKYAAAGFYYASDGDGVVCYCCGIRRYGWVEADDPMEQHKRINPRCKFIINNSEHNVPANFIGPLRRIVASLENIPLYRAPVEHVSRSQNSADSSDEDFLDDCYPCGQGFHGNLISRHIVSEASQQVLNCGYTPAQIRDCVKEILRDDKNAQPGVDDLLQKVFEMTNNEPAL